jgi:hypothetical protein
MKSLEGKHFCFKPLITLVVTKGKALLSWNYYVDLGLLAQCSHSNFLIGGPYPILKGLDEKSGIGNIRKVWK